MSSQAQSIPTPYAEVRPRSRVSPRIVYGLLAALGILVVGLGAVYLVVGGSWHIAVVLVLLLPALMILHRYPYLAVIAWLVLSPFLVQTPSAIERQIYWIIHRFLPPFTLILILVSTAMNVRLRELPRLRLPEFAMAGYLIISAWSILFQNTTPLQTLYRFYDSVFIPMCLYAIVRLTAPGPRLMKWLLPVALFITVSQVSIGALSWIKPGVLPSAWLEYQGMRTTGSLNSVSVYTTTLIFTGLLVLHKAMTSRPGLKRLALFGVFLSVMYAVFISYSRASWLMGLLVLVGLVLIYPRFMLRLGLILGPLVLLAGGLLFSSQIKQASERLKSSDHTALSRLPVLVAAYRMFEAKPVFGWGYDNFDRFDRRFQGRFGDLVNPDEKDLTSHNVYMTLLAEQGVVGTALFLAPVIYLLWRSLKKFLVLPRQGWRSRKTLGLLWLVILGHVVVNNFAPMVVVFGLGMYWLTLGLIAEQVCARKVDIR